MEQIEINGSKHPVYFDWLAIENVSEFVGDNSLDATAKKLNSYVQSLKFTRFVAFEGIKCGYRKIGEPCPFASSDELAEAVKNYSELGSIVGIYTTAVSEFYASEDSTETDKKKVTVKA
jgi:hypothetical protein